MRTAYKLKTVLSGEKTMESLRFIQTAHGERKQSFPFPGVDRGTAVLASICELADLPNGEHAIPFNGDAVMTIHGVAPRADFVDIRYSINWGVDLNFLITILKFP